LVQAPSSRNCRLPDAIDKAMPLRARQALGVEADQTAGRERARERADDAGRMKALMMKAAAGDARDPRAGLDRGDVRGDDGGAARTAPRGDRRAASAAR
jgi:hypothetical protein